jgi:hypothetical protein
VSEFWSGAVVGLVIVGAVFSWMRLLVRRPRRVRHRHTFGKWSILSGSMFLIQWRQCSDPECGWRESRSI